MKLVLQKHHRLIFYGLWLLLGLIQSGLTELQDDEAYYWVYSQYPAWGYFDHPPMIGLLVKMGYSIFPNELGVRLFPLLLNVFSLLLIEKLIDKKNPCLSGRQALLFYAIALSVAVLQVSGFVASPDIPLIFFTALFFFCYKRFTRNYSLLNSFLLGLSVALLLYTKYQAVLVIFFVLLSNIKLLTKYQTYIAGITAVLLFAPHLWWQYQHDWISFRYHLFESNVNIYQPAFTLEYLIGQLLLAGPVASFILLPAAFLYKAQTETERALRFTMIGIYAFFFLSSFRGKTEANWTSPALVPLIILSHQFLKNRLRWQSGLFKLLPVTLILVLSFRIVMIEDILPVKEIQKRYHAWKNWPEEMRARTKGLPVVFSNSYQRASKYWFYSAQITYSQNWFRERRNNYNFWPVEDSLLGKPVYFMDKYQVFRFPDSLKTSIGWVGYRYDSSFASFAKVKIITQKKITARPGVTFSIPCKVEMPQQYERFILTHSSLSDTTKIGVFNKHGWIKDILIAVPLRSMAKQKEFIVRIAPELPAGKYYLLFSIKKGYYNSTHNSDKTELVIQ